MASAQTAWPPLELPPSVFIAHLAEHAPLQDGVVTLTSLHTVHHCDLYLACACQHHIPGAIDLFELHYLRKVATLLRRSEGSPAVIDELCQHLREDLFVAQPDSTQKTPKIARYDGRGSLKSWLRVVAVRTALTLRRSRQRECHQPLEEASLAVLPLVGSPEQTLLRQQHKSDIKQALADAIAGLPPNRVNVLRMHLLDGLTLEKIASLYRVNRSSVKRWLDDARTQLLSGLRNRLQARLRLPHKDIDSLLVGLRSQLDLSISRILRPASP
ncbi:MAG TPA: sigma-70 family RNA polymerase sigma factor [Pseudomonadota bacterium]|nr:sigma-70 family RNA polymerase sigma factor [Pseudomonadota bacterium]